MAKHESILKKKKQSNSSKRNVSFAASTTANNINRPNTDVSFISDEHEHHYRNSLPLKNGHHKSNKKYREMNDDEEDALDPKNAEDMFDNESDADKWTKQIEIREAKSARAIKRIAGDDDGKGDEDGRFASKKRNHGPIRGDSFQGEENVDERFSLLHDASIGSNHEANDTFEKGQYPIEPFNLSAEREDGMGYFDGDTYIFRKNRGEEEEDAWLESVNDEEESSMKHTSSSNSSMSYIPNKVKKAGTDRIDETLTKEQVYDQLIPLLSSDSETVMGALSRYGTIVKREKKLKGKMTHDSASYTALNKITELSNLCMMKFDDGSNIYDLNRGKLQQYLSKSDQNNAEKRKRGGYFMDYSADSRNVTSASKRLKIDTTLNVSAAKEQIFWEYKGNQDNLIHGPYSTTQMMGWIEAGYFVGDAAVDVRIRKEQKPKEDTVDDLLGDLEDSDNEENDSDTKHSQTWQRSDEVTFESFL